MITLVARVHILTVFTRADLGADIWDPRHPVVLTGGVPLHRDVLLVEPGGGGAHLHHGDPGHHLTPAGAGDGGLGERDLAAARHLPHLAYFRIFSVLVIEWFMMIWKY